MPFQVNVIGYTDVGHTWLGGQINYFNGGYWFGTSVGGDVPPIPSWGQYLHASEIYNGYIYVMGGIDPYNRLTGAGSGVPWYANNRNYYYNIATQSWASRTVMPVAKAAMASILYGGNIWVLGGIRQDTSANTYYYADNDRYSISGNSWDTSSYTDMPAARYGHAAVAHGAYFYVFGGYNSSNNGTTTIYRYDVAGNSWTTLDDVCPAALLYNQGFSDGTKIWLFDGSKFRTYTPPTPPATSGGTWETKSTIPLPSTSFAGTPSKPVKIDNFAYVNLFGMMLRYDLNADYWLLLENPPVMVTGGHYLADSNYIYLAGGGRPYTHNNFGFYYTTPYYCASPTFFRYKL